MPKKSIKKYTKLSKKTTKYHKKQLNKRSKKRSKKQTKKGGGYRRNWYCFGTMTILSNHKRTAEKYLNQLNNAGVHPSDIEIYQAKGQTMPSFGKNEEHREGYSRINICYYADRQILFSRF